MSVVEAKMFNNQLNSFSPGHIRSRSYNQLVSLTMGRTSPSTHQSGGSYTGGGGSHHPGGYHHNDGGHHHSNKKRRYFDVVADGTDLGSGNKRCRTAPPSPQSPAKQGNRVENSVSDLKMSGVGTNLLKLQGFLNLVGVLGVSSVLGKLNLDELIKMRSRSLSPNKKLGTLISPRSSQVSTPTKPRVGRKTNPRVNPGVYPRVYPGVKLAFPLPSLNSALCEAPDTPKTPIKLRPIAPTVSLDYLDTYKPNDEQWRCGVLHTIGKDSKHFNIKEYQYLNNHALAAPAYVDRPQFDSKISSKIRQKTTSHLYPPCIRDKIYSERKINFPYESNYTYMNKTYLNDVENYPEYLELAKSLIHLSNSLANSLSRYPQRHQVTSRVVEANNINESGNGRGGSGNHYHHHYSPDRPSRLSHSSSRSHTTHTKTKHTTHNYHSDTTEGPTTPPSTHAKAVFVPVTPPSSKPASKADILQSPTKNHQSSSCRVCISCGSDQSPCWRPSWSIKEGQLCNSCGLRYKKTSARCLNDSCKKIPAKGEWTLMQSKGKSVFSDGEEGYSCLDCSSRVEVRK